MAFNNNIKIYHHLKVVPPSSSSQKTTIIPLTSYDLLFLRSRPVERIFFYTLPNPQSHPSFFFQNIVQSLHSSLSLTLQHFLPIAGKIVWPSDSSKPFICFNPNDNDTGVSLLIAESDADFDHVISNSPHEASLSRSFIPYLESSDSFASIISLQITFFPNSGFGIGITTHHAVFDGKSSSMFMKAWAYICNKIIQSETPTLLPELEPSFNREIIHDDKNGDNSIERINKLFQIENENENERSLKIFPFEPKLEDSVRATFKLAREDLDIIKQNVLSKWEISDTNEPKPYTLSSFVLTCAHSVVSIAKAMHGVEKERAKFAFAFAVDCRARLEPEAPNNYFGNCVRGAFMDTKPFDFKEEDCVFEVAKCMHEKIKMIRENGLEGNIFDVYDKYNSLNNEGCETIGIAGSNRFGVYETDFGFGRPKKVEIVSIDGGLAIGLSESKDGNGGVEVGLVRNRHVMDLFSILFHEIFNSNKMHLNF